MQQKSSAKPRRSTTPIPSGTLRSQHREKLDRCLPNPNGPAQSVPSPILSSLNIPNFHAPVAHD